MATTRPEPRRGVADLIVSRLRAAGVRTLFGVPGGGSNLDVIDAAGAAGLPFVLTAGETAAAISAVAQAEITGQLGACLTTLGPGAASVVNGVACAFLDRAPIVVLTDCHPAGAAPVGDIPSAPSAPSAYSACSAAHQRLDHAALLAPVTKSSESLTPDNALQAVTRAIHTATDGRPGPVHLDCPGDVARSPAPTQEATLVAAARSTMSPEDRSRLERMLTAARKPLLLIGLGARRPEDAAAIRGLTERRGIPALVTYKAKGVVPDDHRWFGGVFTNAAIEQPILDESDLLMAIGLDPVELIPRAWVGRQPVVYCGPWRVEDAHVPFAVQLVTDVPEGVRHIDAHLSSDWDPERVRHHVDEGRRAIDVRAAGLSAQRVVQIAAARLARTAGRVTVDAGAHMFPATMLWPVCDPNRMLISNGLSTMGFALPAAIGAALVDRSRPVVALTGDGGLLMCVSELLTAVRERLRIVTIVFSDASLSLIEIKQQARRLAAAGVALGVIDWPALARSFGADAWAAATEKELEDVLEQAVACEGPSLVEAKIDRSNYGATLRAVRG